jgi:hypothetical protein
MANPDLPKGFELWGNAVRINEYESGSACYPGDLVNLASDGQVDPASTGGIILGVCLSYASAAGVKIMVADHPDQLVACQADETEIDVQTDIGNMCDHVATAGNSTYKTSRHELDSSTVGTSAAGLQILRIEPVSGNALGTNVKVVCRINEHALGQGAGIAGV